MALQPASRGGLLEGVARLPRQLLGRSGGAAAAGYTALRPHLALPVRPSRASAARVPPRLLTVAARGAGGEGSVPSAAEAAAPVRATNDLLRRFREMGERVRQEYRPPPGAEGDEAMLRVRPGRGGGAQGRCLERGIQERRRSAL
jgi:hypothetical protein